MVRFRKFAAKSSPAGLNVSPWTASSEFPGVLCVADPVSVIVNPASCSLIVTSNRQVWRAKCQTLRRIPSVAKADVYGSKDSHVKRSGMPRSVSPSADTTTALSVSKFDSEFQFDSGAKRQLCHADRRPNVATCFTEDRGKHIASSVGNLRLIGESRGAANKDCPNVSTYSGTLC